MFGEYLSTQTVSLIYVGGVAYPDPYSTIGNASAYINLSESSVRTTFRRLIQPGAEPLVYLPMLLRLSTVILETNEKIS